MGIYQRRKLSKKGSGESEQEKEKEKQIRATELQVKLRHDPRRKSYSVVRVLSYRQSTTEHKQVAPGTPLHESE